MAFHLHEYYAHPICPLYMNYNMKLNLPNLLLAIVYNWCLCIILYILSLYQQSTNTPTDEVEVGLDHLGLLVGPRAAAHLLAVALAHLLWNRQTNGMVEADVLGVLGGEMMNLNFHLIQRSNWQGCWLIKVAWGSMGVGFRRYSFNQAITHFTYY